MTITQYMPRSAWDTSGSTRRFAAALDPNRVLGKVLHWPGAQSIRKIGTDPAYIARLLRGYRNWHIHSRGWPDIGYLDAVDQAGRVWELAGFRVAAHSATKQYPQANRERVGTLLLLGMDEQATPEMRSAVISLRSEVRTGLKPFGWKPLPKCVDLHGHRHMLGATTACPGDHATTLIVTGGFTVPVLRPPTATPQPRRNSHAKRPYAQGEVRRIQSILATAGYYSGALDDDYGPMTAGSVKDYQGEQLYGALKPDADWGPVTDAHYEWVLVLQAALNGWRTSLKVPDLRVDGDFRDISKARTLLWQRVTRGVAYPRRARLDGLPGLLTCKGLKIDPHPKDR